MQDDLTRNKRVISVLDPAIDWSSAEVMGEYARTRDESLVTLRQQTGAWAVVRPLTVGEFSAVDGVSGSGKLVQAFRLACLEVENTPAAGLSVKPRGTARIGGTDTAVWTDDELAVVARHYGARYLYEIGLVIYERALQGNAWGGGVLYTLPQSSLDGLTETRPLHAAPSPSSGGTDSSAA